MPWEKLPALETRPHPTCNCCPPVPGRACMRKLVAVGFGSATVTCDGRLKIDGEHPKDDQWVTFADAERLAAVHPDHDWRVTLRGPLHGESFQRHGPEEWILVEVFDGFA